MARRRFFFVISFSTLAAATSPAAGSQSESDSGWVSEVRVGGLRHDAGIFSLSKEKSWDVNAEALFRSPEWLDTLWSPRPHLGVSINAEGLTSQVYTGLTWDHDVTQALFVEFSLGGSANDGHLNVPAPSRKALGSHLEFHESLSLGYRLTAQSSISIMLDHISNAGLARYNEGMETIGPRYGYKF
jgi:lipid A 3-O-deacylase